MVRDDGIVKVLDFGLARRLPAAGGAGRHGGHGPGHLVGTVRYMSPEQAAGETVGSASDIFWLGIVLYELATGPAPVPGHSQGRHLHATVDSPAAAPR